MGLGRRRVRGRCRAATTIVGTAIVVFGAPAVAVADAGSSSPTPTALTATPSPTGHPGTGAASISAATSPHADPVQSGGLVLTQRCDDNGVLVTVSNATARDATITIGGEPEGLRFVAPADGSGSVHVGFGAQAALVGQDIL